MPQLEIDSDPSLRLTTALLIYESSQHHGRGEEPVVTQHRVEKGVIQPGDALDLDAFKRILEQGAAKQDEARAGWTWQFPRLMAESRNWRVWWSPAGTQQVFIGDDGGTPKVLKAWIPALVWCGHRSRPSCYLWAYDGHTAPTPDTDMYRPRGINHIHHDSGICNGSMQLADNTPPSWEKAFWSSRFKSPGNLKQTKPYACKEAFTKVGPLASVLPRDTSAD